MIKLLPQPRYQCARCKKIYTEESEAHYCCTTECQQKVCYQCMRCGQMYWSKYSAMTCCCPDPISIFVYLCPSCEKWHDTEQAAIDCCLPKNLKDWGFGDVVFHEEETESLHAKR